MTPEELDAAREEDARVRALRVPHVTVVTVRGSRRTMSAPGQRRNLCGAALTDSDLLYADAKRIKHKKNQADWQWLIERRFCPECLSRVA